MKLRILAVVVLLILGCSAAFGQSYSFGFLSYTGGLQYCDYEVLTVAAPYAAGTHDLKDVCGLPINAVMVGFQGSIPHTTGQPVVGIVYMLADNTFDAQYLGVEGCQIDWVTKLKASTPGDIRRGHFGWSFYFTCGGGGDYLGNWGFLSTTLGAKQNGQVKMSVGTAVQQIKSKR